MSPFGVEADVAQHGLPGLGLQRRGHLPGGDAVGLGRRLRPDLDGSVGVEDIALRIDVLGPEALPPPRRRSGACAGRC